MNSWLQYSIVFFSKATWAALETPCACVDSLQRVSGARAVLRPLAVQCPSLPPDAERSPAPSPSRRQRSLPVDPPRGAIPCWSKRRRPLPRHRRAEACQQNCLEDENKTRRGRGSGPRSDAGNSARELSAAHELTRGVNCNWTFLKCGRGNSPPVIRAAIRCSSPPVRNQRRVLHGAGLNSTCRGASRAPGPRGCDRAHAS